MNLNNYDFIKSLKVDKDMVALYKKKILQTLEKEIYIHLSDEFIDINNYSINCDEQSVQGELAILTEKLSAFMAYQEAIYDMIIDSKLLPVKSIPIQMVIIILGYNIRKRWNTYRTLKNQLHI